MAVAVPPLRLATLDDADAIEALMKVSIRELFPHFYDDIQTRSSVEYGRSTAALPYGRMLPTPTF